MRKMVTAAALRQRTEQLTVEFDGLEINFEAAVRRYNHVIEEEIRQEETMSGGLVKLLSRVVVSWDLMESEAKDAKPYPLTEAALSELPTEFLSAVAQRITEAQGPKSTTTAPSSAT